MKTLILMRHAKSSWDDAALADHERPLNKRGKRDAPQMGRWLAKEGLKPALMVSSTAKRALATAKAVAEACVYKKHILNEPRLYEADAAGLLEIVRELPDQASNALLIGHNPTMEDLVSRLGGQPHRMPTGAVAVFTFEAASWRDIGDTATLTASAKPKQFR